MPVERLDGPWPSRPARVTSASASGAELRIKSGSGDVHIDRPTRPRRCPPAAATSRSAPRNGPLVIKTGSGDLEIGRALDGVSMSTGTGDMRSTGPRASSAPSAPPATSSRHPGRRPRLDRPDHRQRRVHSNLRGAGQPEPGPDYVELRAKTVSGDISSSKSETTPQPPTTTQEITMNDQSVLNEQLTRHLINERITPAAEPHLETGSRRHRLAQRRGRRRRRSTSRCATSSPWRWASTARWARS